MILGIVCKANVTKIILKGNTIVQFDKGTLIKQAKIPFLKQNNFDRAS